MRVTVLPMGPGQRHAVDDVEVIEFMEQRLAISGEGAAALHRAIAAAGKAFSLDVDGVLFEDCHILGGERIGSPHAAYAAFKVHFRSKGPTPDM